MVEPRPVSNLLLCVSGAFQAYATPGLVLALLRHVAEDVRVVVSPSASKLVSPYAIEVASRHDVFVEMTQRGDGIHLPHIELAEWANLILIFPATVNLISKLAGGFCDELIPAVAMAGSCPVMIQPVTNPTMWNNPRVQRNVDTLRADGLEILEPLPAIEVGTREGLDQIDAPFPYPTLLARMKNAAKTNR